MPKRCGWVKMNNPLYVAYHDEEWGQPLHDDQALFELLCMETYQAGLSWETVLNKRQAFREAFHGYQVQAVADMTDTELEALLDNPAIIRNRAKIFATRANAQAFLRLQAECGSFDAYLWSFVEGKTVVNDVPDYRQAPAKTPLSEKLAKDLKKEVSSSQAQSLSCLFLQAAGLVDDHENDCEWKSVSYVLTPKKLDNQFIRRI